MAVVWTISQLERQASDGGVTTAHWSASDSEVVGEVTHIGSCYSSCNFSPDSSAGDFIAFADITEVTAIAWVKATLDAMTADSVSGVETSIAEQIAISKTPVSIAGLPW